MVLLVTSDNEQFNADKDVVERSVLIKNMLEGLFPIPCYSTPRVTIILTFFLSCRCWRVRPTYSSAQCLFKCHEEGASY